MKENQIWVLRVTVETALDGCVSKNVNWLHKCELHILPDHLNQNVHIFGADKTMIWKNSKVHYPHNSCNESVCPATVSV